MTAGRRAVRLVVDGMAARTPGFTFKGVRGYWEPIAFEDLKAGDIFRLFEPDGTPDQFVDGVHQTAVALADASPSGLQGDLTVRWGVRSMLVRGFKA